MLVALKLGILGLVDHTHPAAPELFENAGMRDGLAYHGESPPVPEMLGRACKQVNLVPGGVRRHGSNE